MHRIPIFDIDDTLTIRCAIRTACQMYRSAGAYAIAWDFPNLAFEPKEPGDLGQSLNYTLPSKLSRLVVIAFGKLLSDDLLRHGRAIARAQSAKTTRADRATANAKIKASLQQPGMSLNRILTEMEEARVPAAGVKLAIGQKRLTHVGIVLLNGEQAVRAVRERLHITNHATLTVLSERDGWPVM